MRSAEDGLDFIAPPNWWLHWQVENKPGTTIGWFKSQLAVERFGDPLAKGQAKSNSWCRVGGVLIGFAKCLEELPSLPADDSGSKIPDGQLKFVAAILRRQNNAAVRGRFRVLASVVNQIEQNSLDSLWIRLDRNGSSLGAGFDCKFQFCLNCSIPKAS